MSEWEMLTRLPFLMSSMGWLEAIMWLERLVLNDSSWSPDVTSRAPQCFAALDLPADFDMGTAGVDAGFPLVI